MICAFALATPAALGVGPDPLPAHFLLACSGTLATPANAVVSEILADGQVDIETRTIHGFGLGGQPVRSIDATYISFGGGIGGRGERLIEGSIDRQTLETRIVVYGSDDEGDPLMAIRLDCRMVLPEA
jgi:hypothetical protein